MPYFGARSESELHYFGPLMKVPHGFLYINFAFSHVPGAPRHCTQDRIRERIANVARLLHDRNCVAHCCGLRDMERGYG